MSGDHTSPAVARSAATCVMVIFGASGDLTKRKLIPALYNLAMDGLLPKEFAIVGCARRSQSDDGFRDQLTKDVQTMAECAVDTKLWAWFLERIHYVPGGPMFLFICVPEAIMDLNPGRRK